MKKTSEYYLLRVLTTVGNILFVLWLLGNGIKEGFRATVYEAISYISLTILLGLNSYLLWSKNR
jgi:hypothetical protein